MNYDVIIVGAGIVGLASAYQILEAAPKTKILILEKETGPAFHQSGHNSGVIHSGIYYKPGSAKAINCANGYQQLLDFCNKESIPYELCGKVIVATQAEELETLQSIFMRGLANGLQKIRLIEADELKQIEPHVNGIKGIHVPQAGIINYKLVAQKYAEKIIEKGALIQYQEKVIKTTPATSTIKVETNKQAYYAKTMLNCAGLYSDKIAQLQNKNKDLKIIPFRGEYYDLKPEKAHLVKHLIYPVPDPNFPFLGVHFTRMIEGGIEAGPNAVLAFRREGYKNTNFNLSEFFETISYLGFRKVAKKHWRAGWKELYRSYSKKAFTSALQKLIPEIKSSDIVRGGAGVRAQACFSDGRLADDFIIRESPFCVHVCNAPSPAATSSLSIGASLAEIILARLA